MPGTTWLESSFAKRHLQVLVASKLNMSKQCAPMAKKTSCCLGCVRQNTGHWQKVKGGCLFPLCSTGEATSGCCVQCWALEDKTDMDLLDWVQQKTLFNAAFEEGGLNYVISRGPFQSQLFYDSVILDLFSVKAAFRVASYMEKK